MVGQLGVPGLLAAPHVEKGEGKEEGCATIPSHEMGRKSAPEQLRRRSCAIFLLVLALMEDGPPGPPGHHAARTAKRRKPEPAATQLPGMEATPVSETDLPSVIALGVFAKWPNG